MCMVVYIASRSPLPLVPWRSDAPAFNVTALSEHTERVRRHFALPHVVCAGSHTSCGCGFNEGRGYPDPEDDPKERAAALESSAQLARFVREHRVEQVFSCWSGDEGEEQAFTRRVAPEALVADDFAFRERELLTIDYDVA
jgi:hypothetical protein